MKKEKALILKIQELQGLLEDRATYFKNNEKEATNRYSELYIEVDLELEELGYEHVNLHRSLHSIWSFSKTQGLATYDQRREYIRNLYEDILFDLNRKLAKEPDPKHWNTANEQLEDELEPIRTQWLKAKNYIYTTPPDFENSIKESINSIESLLMILLNRPGDTLGQMIKQPDIDEDIRRIISQVYGLVSNKDFVRHGGTQAQVINEEDAEFFLELSAISIVYLKKKLRP